METKLSSYLPYRGRIIFYFHSVSPWSNVSRMLTMLGTRDFGSEFRRRYFPGSSPKSLIFPRFRRSEFSRWRSGEILKVRARRAILLYRQVTQQSQHALSRSFEKSWTDIRNGRRNLEEEIRLSCPNGGNTGKIKSARTWSLTVHDWQCAPSIKPDWHLRPTRKYA